MDDGGAPIESAVPASTGAVKASGSGRLRITGPQLRRSILIAVVVCVWLTLFNQYDRILAGHYDLLLLSRIALNFATPFTVSTVTTVWNNLRKADRPVSGGNAPIQSSRADP